MYEILNKNVFYYKVVLFNIIDLKILLCFCLMIIIICDNYYWVFIFYLEIIYYVLLEFDL